MLDKDLTMTLIDIYFDVYFFYIPGRKPSIVPKIM